MRRYVKRKGAGLPLKNVLLSLDDGRILKILRGSKDLMEGRQLAKINGAVVANLTPINAGEVVRTVPGKDGRKAVLHALTLKKKKIIFAILGSCDGVESNGTPVGAEAKNEI